MGQQERRRIQRIRLDRSVKGRLSGMRVSILDLSTTGARVEHSFPLSSGRRLRLDFLWEDQLISVNCDVTRCTAEHTGSAKSIAYSSGLHFSDTAVASREAIKNVIAEIVMRDLQTLKKELRASLQAQATSS